MEALPREMKAFLLHVEIRTVNNKFYKLNVRLPELLQSLEAEVDAIVSKQITRGECYDKCEVY